MRRIVVIAAGMAGVHAAARLKRRLFTHEINLILPAAVAAPFEGDGPVSKRRAATLPNLELLTTREVGVIEAQDIMPDLAAKEVTVSSTRGALTIRYTDLVIEIPAEVRIPRALQKANNVFAWPVPEFAADPAPCDNALAEAAASGRPVLVVGDGAPALEALFLATEAGAQARWLRTEAEETPALDPHLAALVLQRLGKAVTCTPLPACAPDRLGFAVSPDGTALERIILPDGEEIACACCLWTSPLMARHPLLREDGVYLDAFGRITADKDYAEQAGLHLMGDGSVIPGALLAFSGGTIPVFPGGGENAALSAWLAVDALTGARPLAASARNAVYGSLALREAFTPGLHFGRIGLTQAEAKKQQMETEHAIIGMPPAFDKDDSGNDEGPPCLILSLFCDKQSRTLVGAQVLGIAVSRNETDGLLGMAQAALAEGTPLSALARRGQAGLPGYMLATAASILRNKLDTVIKGISPDEFLASRAAGAEFFTLDLRSLPDWRAGHVPDAYNIPLTQLKKRLQDEVPRFTPIVLVSDCGRDAYAAASRLAGLGATELYVLDGGMRLWPYALETR